MLMERAERGEGGGGTLGSGVGGREEGGLSKDIWPLRGRGA
jgi:hypothetical protein